MKKTLVLTLIVLVTLIGFGFHAISYVQAADCKKVEGASKEELQAVIDACSAKVEELGKQRTTLAEQIEYMDSQIYLTELRIQENEVLKVRLQKEIENLGTRIGELDTTLTKVSISATAKIEEMYKRERGNRMLKLLASSSNLPTLIRTAGYLKKTQENDRNLLIRLQDTKVNFSEQKSLREQKEDELEALNQELQAYQNNLASQQREKEVLLEVTKNDEAQYQQLLLEAQAEIAAIQGIIAGNGVETVIGDVSKGSVIAYLITTASCNSTGEHLHFTVERGGGTLNPFEFLKPISAQIWASDPFNPSGSWDWPLDEPIDFNQGYGVTAFSSYSTLYNFHNGIDIAGSSNAVKAVSDGTLSRGYYTGSGGCALPYAKLVHKDSDITTYYLHVQ